MFQHHRDRTLIVRQFSCIDTGRVFVRPLRGEPTTCEGQVFNLNDVTKEDDLITVDIDRKKVYIYRKN